MVRFMLYNSKHKKGLNIMKKMILSLLLLLSYSSALFAEHSISAPYMGYTDYNDTQMNSSYDIGIFSRNVDENGSYDMFLNYNHITKNTDNNDSNSTASDSTIKNISLGLLRRYNYSDTTKLLAAFNLNLSTDDGYDQIFSILGGIEQTIDIIKVGFNGSYSHFNSSALAKSSLQASPYFGFYFGHPKSVMGNFYVKVIYDIIALTSPTSGISSTYKSHALDITHFKYGFETNVQLWFGESLYALRSNGLVNQYLNIMYQDGVYISLKYNFTDKTSIQASTLSQTYTAVGDGSESKLKSYLLSANFKF